MAELTPSPLAPAQFPDLPPLAGIKLATAATGLKYKGRDDLFLIMADEGSSFAGVFTKSATAAAPVPVSRAGLKSRQARAVLTNAGNATLPAHKRRYIQFVTQYQHSSGERA